MNILIVDDNNDNRYMLESLLKGNGYDVKSASNGAEALQFLERGSCDLIISDILMPVMDGFELCRKVRNGDEHRHIPFIIYTATYTGPQDEEFALKIGADRFIVKPCEPEVFINAVKEVMELRKVRISGKVPLAEESEVLKLYNERLVRKLEQKMLQLEKEVQTRRETEEILRRSEEKYRSLYNSVRDAILVSDADMNITGCNSSFVDLFGYSYDEISGMKTLLLYKDEEEFRRIGQILEQHMDDAGLLYTAVFKKKDGTLFPCEVNVFYLRNDEKSVTGFSGLIRDISERKRAENIQKDLELQLHQAQKMESVGRLAGGMAHDFNNLLSIILGYGEMLLEAIDRESPFHNKLEQIYIAGQRARDLIRQLLAFSRKQVLEMKAVDINSVVTGFEKLLRRLIGEDIRLELILNPEPLSVKADAQQIEQVLMNLAVNARDAMPGGGTLTIETAAIDLIDGYMEKKLDVQPGTYVMIGVRDNGCGMDKLILEHIFEPFFTTKSVDQGTGLGLATSYGIIKQHGGSIWVYSEPGEGSVFRIYLPLSTGEAAVQSPEEKQQVPVYGNATVLIIEDDASLRDLTCEILADHGYTVIDAADPANAISKTKDIHDPIHLVLTDVIMPGMKGPEVFDIISRYHPESRVLYMSGYSDIMNSSNDVVEDGVHFIQKPFTVKGLLEKCRFVLSQ